MLPTVHWPRARPERSRRVPPGFLGGKLRVAPVCVGPRLASKHNANLGHRASLCATSCTLTMLLSYAYIPP